MIKDEVQITHPINRNEFFGNFENGRLTKWIDRYKNENSSN